MTPEVRARQVLEDWMLQRALLSAGVGAGLLLLGETTPLHYARVLVFVLFADGLLGLVARRRDRKWTFALLAELVLLVWPANVLISGALLLVLLFAREWSPGLLVVVLGWSALNIGVYFTSALRRTGSLRAALIAWGGVLLAQGIFLRGGRSVPRLLRANMVLFFSELARPA